MAFNSAGIWSDVVSSPISSSVSVSPVSSLAEAKKRTLTFIVLCNNAHTLAPQQHDIDVGNTPNVKFPTMN